MTRMCEGPSVSMKYDSTRASLRVCPFHEEAVLNTCDTAGGHRPLAAVQQNAGCHTLDGGAGGGTEIADRFERLRVRHAGTQEGQRMAKNFWQKVLRRSDATTSVQKRTQAAEWYRMSRFARGLPRVYRVFLQATKKERLCVIRIILKKTDSNSSVWVS
jgi:hypothetical protein